MESVSPLKSRTNFDICAPNRLDQARASKRLIASPPKVRPVHRLCGLQASELQRIPCPASSMSCKHFRKPPTTKHLLVHRLFQSAQRFSIIAPDPSEHTAQTHPFLRSAVTVPNPGRRSICASQFRSSARSRASSSSSSIFTALLNLDAFQLQKQKILVHRGQKQGHRLVLLPRTLILVPAFCQIFCALGKLGDR